MDLTIIRKDIRPDECREWAKTDSDFDNIREDECFQALIQ